jgi:hypothetical protein
MDFAQYEVDLYDLQWAWNNANDTYPSEPTADTMAVSQVQGWGGELSLDDAWGGGDSGEAAARGLLVALPVSRRRSL